MKNILHVDLGSHYGGAEKVVEKSYIYANKEKYNMSILCLEGSLFHKELLNNKKFNNHDIITIKSKFNIFKNSRYIRGIISQKHIQLLHTHGILSNLYAEFFRFGKKIPIIYTIHSKADFDRGMSLKGKIMLILEKIMIKRNNKNICVSKDIYNYMISRGIKGKKIDLIYNGLESIQEVNLERTKYFNNTNKVICCIGRLTGVKGQDDLLKAIYILKDRGIYINCILAGDGEEREDLIKIIEDYDIKEQVRLIGFIKDVNEVLNNSDIFVMSSKMEGLPIALLEAIRYNIPVLVPNVGGIPEVINNNNGTLFNVGDINDLVEKLTYCINNTEEIEEKAKNALNDYSIKWSIDVYIKKLQQLYDKILSEKYK